MTEDEESKVIVYPFYFFTLFFALIFVFGGFPRIPTYYEELSLGLSVKMLRVLMFMQYLLVLSITGGLYLYDYRTKHNTEINFRTNIQLYWIICETFAFLTIYSISVEVLVVGFLFEYGFHYTSGYIIFMQICCVLGIIFLHLIRFFEHRFKEEKLEKIAQFWRVTYIKMDHDLYTENKVRLKEKIKKSLDDLDKLEDNLNWSRCKQKIQDLIREGEQLLTVVRNEIHLIKYDINEACEHMEHKLNSHAVLSLNESIQMFEDIMRFTKTCSANHWRDLHSQVDRMLILLVKQNPDLRDHNIEIHHVPLNLSDYSVLTEMESILGDQIPITKKGNSFTWGAIVENAHIVHLIISHRRLEYLPVSIGNLHFLTVLELSYCGLREVPASIGNLSQLTLLNLQHNALQFLPTSIGNLSNLEIFSISDNHLLQLPESIGLLSELFRIRINRNDLQLIPLSLLQLTHLESIQIQENPFIFRYPTRIADLKRFLQTLSSMCAQLLNHVDLTVEFVLSTQFRYLLIRYGAFLKEKWKDSKTAQGKRMFRMLTSLELEQIRHLGILL